MAFTEQLWNDCVTGTFSSHLSRCRLWIERTMMTCSTCAAPDGSIKGSTINSRGHVDEIARQSEFCPSACAVNSKFSAQSLTFDFAYTGVIARLLPILLSLYIVRDPS
jgi:hypothetical protein